MARMLAKAAAAADGYNMSPSSRDDVPEWSSGRSEDVGLATEPNWFALGVLLGLVRCRKTTVPLREGVGPLTQPSSASEHPTTGRAHVDGLSNAHLLHHAARVVP